MKECEKCIHFYECDNMGLYEECLPDMKYYEEQKDDEENQQSEIKS